MYIPNMQTNQSMTSCSGSQKQSNAGKPLGLAGLFPLDIILHPWPIQVVALNTASPSAGPLTAVAQEQQACIDLKALSVHDAGSTFVVL